MDVTLPADCAREFEAVRLLASGGYGSVVLKLLEAHVRGDPAVLARFVAEARITAALAHSHVVVVIAAGADAGVPWIAYEYLEGGSLRDALDRGPMAWSDAVAACAQVARALAAAHACGVLHRDVKPDNVLAGGAGHWKVTDFGIARFAGSGVHTGTGLVLGTPSYLAPEASRGEPEVRSDLYALGALLFELLEGRSPFSGRTPVAMLEAHLFAAPPPVAAAPRPVAALVERLLRKEPAGQPATAEALAAELDALGGTIAARTQDTARVAVPATFELGSGDRINRVFRASVSSSGGACGRIDGFRRDQRRPKRRWRPAPRSGHNPARWRSAASLSTACSRSSRGTPIAGTSGWASGGSSAGAAPGTPPARRSRRRWWSRSGIIRDGGSKRPTITLAEGHDFFAHPRLSADETKLAWLTWEHSDMPWDATRLWTATLDADGHATGAAVVAGDGERVAVYQPGWSYDGVLHYVSETSGWWNLYARVDGKERALYPMEAEFGRPLWRFGSSTYAFLPGGALLVTYCTKGTWSLAKLEPATRKLERIALPYTEISGPRVGNGAAYMIAVGPKHPRALVALDLVHDQVRTVKRSTDLELDLGYISEAESIEFPSAGGQSAFAFFYAPRNKDFQGPPGAKPPLLVMSHGGPTSAAAPVLSLTIQYWTSRGIAVVDVNYGGSSGYGREYRRRLEGTWGVTHVDDCAAAARFLAHRGSGTATGSPSPAAPRAVTPRCARSRSATPSRRARATTASRTSRRSPTTRTSSSRATSTA